MKASRLKNMFYEIYYKYYRSMLIHSGDDFYSYIIAREVVVPQKAFNNPREWDIFALLHEIGHVITNNPKQKRCLQEYLATQWAIREAKKIGFAVPQSFITIYQNYIWKWRDTSLKCKGKNVPTKEELTLIY